MCSECDEEKNNKMGNMDFLDPKKVRLEQNTEISQWDG